MKLEPIFCISLVLIIQCGPIFCDGNPTDISKKIQTIVIQGIVGHNYSMDINNEVEYIYQFQINSSNNGDIRIHTRCEDSEVELPIMFVVRQRKSVLSWPLPLLSKISGKTYYKASRTLCSDTDDEEEVSQTIYVTVSTASPNKMKYTMKISVESTFIMRIDEEQTATITPPSPRFYRFVFPKSETISPYVLLEVLSDDSTCMTVSVQNATCPIFDEESNVQFEGYWQTMNHKAGMTLRRDRFPLGFYVVFVVHSDDSRCEKPNGAKISFVSATRKKDVRFVIHEKITKIEYIVAIIGLFGIFVLIYVLTIVISCVYCCRNNPETNFINDASDVETSGAGPSTAPDGIEVIAGNSINRAQGPQLLDCPESRQSNTPEGEDSSQPHWLADSTDSSLDETDIDFLVDARRDKNVYRATASLCVSDLAKKNPKVLAKKSQLYLWTLITVAIFYALPVVQLVFTYQNVLHTTGNQDMCYYNYLCSHPLWILSDFNHVYSNIGYIMLGLLFLMLVYRRDRMHQKLALQNIHVESHYGIPRHFGLFYAMGLALVMEGLLSACYHVCPNGSNFQFDTCFMYVIALMCMLKVYQTRHPDINASAYMSFASLAFVILIGVLGVMVGDIYFWAMFTTFHILFCLFLSVQIYYLGRWRLDCGLFRRVWAMWKVDCLASPLLCLKPMYLDRMILIFLANAANWTIAGFGIWQRSPDFASHLLLIFMANLFIYTTFYIIMKLSHREKILFQPLTYIVLTVIFWSLALYIFLQKSTSWQTSPAESRTFNRECLILRFYDTHDIWHTISSIGLFVWYMVLLTLDDDLINTPRNQIAVF